MKVIALPKLNKFLNIKEEYSPFERFYAWVLQETCPLKDLLYDKKNDIDSELMRKINVSAIVLCEKDSKELTDLVRIWLRKTKPQVSEKQVESQTAMLNFSIGPAVRDEKQYKPGFVYIEDGFLNNNRRE